MSSELLILQQIRELLTLIRELLTSQGSGGGGAIDASTLTEQQVQSNLLSTIDNNINILRTNDVNVTLRNEREKLALCVARKVENSPSTGDTTYYLGYENNDYTGNGGFSIAGALWDIKKVIMYENGNVDRCFAQNGRGQYNLIFDDGTQNYLTYTYTI